MNQKSWLVFVVCLLVATSALAVSPQRTFVASSGQDTNPCEFARARAVPEAWRPRSIAISEEGGASLLTPDFRDPSEKLSLVNEYATTKPDDCAGFRETVAGNLPVRRLA